MNITNIQGVVTLSNGVALPYFRLGVSGLKVGQEVVNAIRYALKIAYRLIYTAAIYGNEKSVRQGIRENGIACKKVFITTKLWNSDQRYD